MCVCACMHASASIHILAKMILSQCLFKNGIGGDLLLSLVIEEKFTKPSKEKSPFNVPLMWWTCMTHVHCFTTQYI